MGTGCLVREAGHWVLQEPDAMEDKRYLDNPSFQKKATLSLPTYMFSTIFLQIHTPYIHYLRIAAYQKSRILPLLIMPVLTFFLSPALPDLSIQEQTWMSLQCILFSFPASCNGIFLCFDAPCAAIPLSH